MSSIGSISSPGRNSGYSDALNIARSGLQDASIRAGTVAHNIANSSTTGFVPDTVSSSSSAFGGVVTQIQRSPGIPEGKSLESVLSGTDIATELTNLVAAKNAYQASATVIKRTEAAWEMLFEQVDAKR